MSPLLIPLFALSIPIIAILAKMVSKWLDIKERQMLAQSEMTAEKAAQYAAHTERLEHRVRVLERIVTDRGMALADEIDSLRDQPVLPRADMMKGE